MNESDVVIEYSRRYEVAKILQNVALPLVLISGIGVAISRGAFSTTSEKLFLIVSGSIFIVSLGLVALSFYRYRCPYCNKNLGVVRKISFCPYCGVTLQSGDGLEADFSSAKNDNRRGLSGEPGANFTPSRSLSRTAASRNLSQGTFRPLASDFPDETYPKDIRMFTTRDEMELTKRYIRLIAKDENPPADGTPAAVADAPSGAEHRADPDNPESSPRWRSKEKRKLT
jgi:hypothetical protein